MIKQMAWNTFKQTGNIDTFMELMQVEDLEKDILGNQKNKCEHTKIDLQQQKENIKL
jgi:hypothetical protein